ncbi:hypothetical protein L596_026091 [Steinernema carpocapsae]|uniref:FAS1 domain-containing protein n=1 Tax=Steinernema carpocapsae TaxID=34508 RepID=A0A4U5M0C2_STECR|nr:hypothetical protein L596_026091 [Steinernema carpocapsae]
MRLTAALFLLTVIAVHADLWALIATNLELEKFRSVCGYFDVCKSYLSDGNAAITVFAPVNDVFLYKPVLFRQTQTEVLSHIANSQIPDLMTGKKWPKQTLVRTTVQNGYLFISQFENNPGNYSYFANAGRICNHESGQWGFISGQQYLYEICSPIGNKPYIGTALSMINDAKGEQFPTTAIKPSDLSNLVVNVQKLQKWFRARLDP